MPFHPLNGPVAIGGSDIQSVKTEIKSQNDHQTLDKRRIDFLQLDYRISHSCYVKANTGKLFILVNPSRVISGGSVPYCYFKAPVGHPDRAGRRLLGACSFFRSDVHRGDSDDTTPLHAACYEGHIEIARLLLDSGATADLDRENDDGDTPMSAATNEGHSAIVDLLETYASGS